jgi:hypothetical protein
MPTPFRKRLTDLAATVALRDRTGDATPPKTGTDASSKRHFLALIVGTLAIMTVGLIVAFTEGGPPDSNATPTVVTTPSPIGAQLDSNASIVAAA